LTKRSGYISWDEYFMGVALLSAQRSKDPNTQVGACVVNKNNRVVGVGYNGFVRGCSDDEFPWERDGGVLDTKYAFVAHAELNAVLNSTQDLSECRIFATLFPCNECAKIIIQSGIREIVYLSDKYADSDSVKAAKKMFEAAQIRFYQLKTDRKSITINFE